MTISAEISVTGAVTGTINCMHVCSGTSADYTVTLPAAAGNAGNLIAFRMAPIASLSKLITLDGNASEKINDSLTRIMWANESCVLLCDGSNWSKIAGLSIPMIGSMYLASNTASTVNASETIVPLDTSGIDNTGVMVNTGANKITLRRPGNYAATGTVILYGNGAAANLTQANIKNGATSIAQVGATLSAGGYVTNVSSKPFVGAASDDIKLFYYQDSGFTSPLLLAPICALSVIEIPSW